MVRGSTLRQQLLPILQKRLAGMDSHVRERIAAMIDSYGLLEQKPSEPPV
jgi:hypothetical protein